MKKTIFLLSLLIAAPSIAIGCQSTGAQYQQLFIDGFKTGAISSLAVDAVRYITPDTAPYNIYHKYGICRDQFTGQIKALLALYLSALSTRCWDDALVRALGVLFGTCVATYTKKIALER